MKATGEVPRVGHGLPGVLEDETDRIRTRRRRFITAAGVAAATGATAGCGNLYSSDPDVLTFMFRGSTEARAVYARAATLFEARTGPQANVISASAGQDPTKLHTPSL